MIIDIFPFFNELDLLDLRLNLLKDVVDETILVESECTHSGKRKPLYFKENKKRYNKFNIKHLIIPYEEHLHSGGVWEREAYQRNYAFKALRNRAAALDYVMLSDLDEIPTPEAVKFADETMSLHTVAKFQQKLYYYYLNGFISDGWHGTVGFNYMLVEDSGDLAGMRVNRQPNTVVIPNAGWHFSYLGGVEKIVEKIEAICHREVDKPEFKDADHLARCLESGDDIYKRNQKITYVKIDGTYPDYITHNLDRFGQYIHA